MPDGSIGNFDWISELTLSGLLVYIIWSSATRKWFWWHYVDELHQRLARSEKEGNDWKVMTLELLSTQRQLVQEVKQARIDSGKGQP